MSLELLLPTTEQREAPNASPRCLTTSSNQSPRCRQKHQGDMVILSPSKCILCTPSPRGDASGEKHEVLYGRGRSPQKAGCAPAIWGYSNHIPSEAEVWRGASSHELLVFLLGRQPHGNLLAHLEEVTCMASFALFSSKGWKGFLVCYFRNKESKARLMCFIDMPRFTGLIN